MEREAIAPIATGKRGLWWKGQGEFDSVDDRLAFIDHYKELLRKDAHEGYVAHGRGLVLLQESGSWFVMSQYIVPGPHDCDHLPPTAGEDLEGYDPVTEMLVGVAEVDGFFRGFWKLTYR